ncbi:MAG: PDZ domain-containing protein [Acidobacteria bacterium]|nr:PDZ domain-containing protein [Acidobacteriota bacterium]
MRYATFLAAAAAMGLATAAAHAQQVQIITAGPDRPGAGAAAVVITTEPGMVMPIDDSPVRLEFVGVPGDPTPLAPPGPGRPVEAPRKMKITYLGVVTSPVGEALGRQLALAPGVGLVVDFVEPGSPADKAGLHRFDVLVRLDDQLLVNQPQLAVLVRMRKPGDQAVLMAKREAAEVKVPVEFLETERLVFGRPGLAAWPPGAAPVALQHRRLADLLRNRGAITISADGNELRAASLTISDGEHTLHITSRDGGRYLVARDKENHVVFEGPIETEAQRQAVPEDIRRKLDGLKVFATPLAPPPDAWPEEDPPEGS